MSIRGHARLAHGLLLFLAGALGAAAVVLPSIAQSETAPAVEAKGGSGPYGEQHFEWSPMAVSANAGGVVTIKNPSTVVAHGVYWSEVPQTPTCSGVPGASSGSSFGTNWSGTCTLPRPGVYHFFCTVHGPSMSGTVTVNAAGETTTTTSPSPPTGSEVAPTQQGPVSYGHGSGAGASPLAGSASGAVRLASSQHGRSVRGSLDISPAGAGGRLEVDLLARSAVLASAGHSAQVRVGRLVRLHVRAGRVSFAVALTARAREALRRHGRLPMTARLLISAPTGASVTIARKLLMRA